MLSLSNKHIVHALLGASLVFVSLLVYVWNFHLLPGDGFGHHRGGPHDFDHDDMCPRGSRRHGNSTYCVPREIGGVRWKRPSDATKIMGLIFYGRRSTVSILDCYLKVRRHLLRRNQDFKCQSRCLC
jgi:hypothetical protein